MRPQLALVCKRRARLWTVDWLVTSEHTEALQIEAEGAGFEPATACAVPVFKTGAFNQTPPPLRKGQAIAWLAIGAGSRCRNYLAAVNSSIS